jgi:uncharacterized RmlC-like cupin family protein
MGKLENRSSRMIYHRLITRIEAVSNDPRYSFMFDNANLGGDTMAEVLGELFRLPPNDTSPCHWHTATESNIIVQGSAGMRHSGMASRASLSVGGFSFVPKRVRHQNSTGSATTLVFSSLDGRFDFHPVEEAQCR